MLQSSTEYSIIAGDLNGKIILWNEGAHRIYGYEAIDVIGKINMNSLYAPDSIKADLPKKIMDETLKNGKFEWVVTRVRKNGDHFTARLIMTARHDAHEKAIGFLLISKDISEEIKIKERTEKNFKVC